MKTSLEIIPEGKRDELNALVELIRDRTPQAEMIILFGSYARGTAVEDIYVEDGATYEYKSDFDILIVVESIKLANSSSRWWKLEDKVHSLGLSTPVTLIVHNLSFVNNRLQEANYFFRDIKEEGIMLYDSDKLELGEIGQPNPKNRTILAQEFFEQWMEDASELLAVFEFCFKRPNYKLSAFHLHQAAESIFTAIMLVFSNYKPKSHDLIKLNRMVCSYDSAFIPAFNYTNQEEEESFKLLNRAYVDARYKKGYTITKEQLEFLAGRIKKLQKLADIICQAKIESFTKV